MLNKMFANLKSKIKEETGSDVSKLTSVWSDKSKSRDGQSVTLSSVDSNASAVFANEVNKIKHGSSFDSDNNHDCISILNEKLKERDTFWQVKLDELQMTLDAAKGEEVMAAVSVARTAQAEAAQQAAQLAVTEQQLHKFREQANCAMQVQEKMENLLEEFDSARREWSKERTELRMSLGAAEAEVGILRDEIALVRASLPPSHPDHRFDGSVSQSESEDFSRILRERTVLERQLQETRVALADIKTSWSGQIASLETQVARLSLQAGEEGSERRRAVQERDDLHKQLTVFKEEQSRLQNQLTNSEAKVSRLSSESAALSAEIRTLKEESNKQTEILKQKNMQIKMDLQEMMRLEETLEEKLKDIQNLENQIDELRIELHQVNGEKDGFIRVLEQNTIEYTELKKQCDIVCRDKDDALLRNAHISQTLELGQCEIRNQETEIEELREKIETLESELKTQKQEMAVYSEYNKSLKLSEKAARDNVQELQLHLDEKTKSAKALQNRISDMKKTLQQEIQNSRTELTTSEDTDISRRYLKHVVIRFLTAKELEARQLTRALSVLLKLNSQEEALLQSALPSKTGLSNWFSGFSPT